MPKKSEILISLPEEEETRLRGIWTELRNPGRRGQPEYIGQKMTFNSWLVRLAGQAAALHGETTQEPQAVRGSAEMAKPAPKSLPKRGRPPGRKSEKYNISLNIDILDWLRAHPDGPAGVANRVLRREMEREQQEPLAPRKK